MLASILFSKQVTNGNKLQTCQKYIIIDSNQYSYCQKTLNLNQLKLVNEIYISSKNYQQIFLYNEQTKYSIISLHVFNYNVNSFSLFGFVIDSQNVKDSQINVSLNFEVVQGALICIKCDVQITNCTLIFQAAGVQISALVVEVNQLMQLQQAFIQYRVTCSNSSGLINVVKVQINLSILDCKLTGANLIESNYSGFIAAVVSQSPNLINFMNFYVCVNNISVLGNQSISVQFDVKHQCDICGENYVVYGLCLDSLQYGQLVGSVMYCVHPFIFSYNQCVCVHGYFVDKLECVDIIQAIHNISSVVNSGQQRITNIESTIQELDNHLYQNASQIIGYIQTAQSLLESYIVSNYSSLNANLQSNTVALDNRIRGNATLLDNSIVSNASTLENYIAQNSTVLDWRIYQNISVLNLSFTNTTNTMSQNIQVLQYNLTALDNYTTNFYLNQSEQNQEMQQVIITLEQQVSCLSNDGKFIDMLCLANYTVNCSENSSCNQLIYVGCSYDHYFKRYQITAQSNFSSGYVFGMANVISNSFIDISDNVYSVIVNPLFQSQSTFTNLKIQLGSQTQNGGSLIQTYISSITINQMNIISRSGSQITISTNSQLNILANSPTGANINNLLVNLSITSQSGNITLINNINGAFNITGYQVLGDYTSTFTVAMIGINIITDLINVKQVCFKPNTYNVGNGSSYLFGNSIFAISTLVIRNLAIVVGNSSYCQILGSVSTTSNNTSSYLFGSIIAYANNTLQLTVNAVIIDSYHKFTTSYVSNSGFLVGYVNSNSSNIQINNVCLYQYMESTTLQFHSFGLVGYISGNITFCNASVTFSVQGASFYNFGIVGYVSYISIYAQVVNLMTSVNISSSNGSSVGSIFGNEGAINCLVQNTSVIRGSISSGSSSTGGIIGYQNLISNTTILNSSVQISNLSGLSQVGGIIGTSYYNATIYNSSVKNSNISGSNTIGGINGFQYSNTSSMVLNSSVQNSNLSGQSQVGGIVGYSNNNATISYSSVQNSVIYGSSSVGGIIGLQDSNTNMMLLNSMVKELNILGSNYIGGIIGFQSSNKTTTILNSSVQQSNLTGSNYVGGIIGYCFSKLYLTNVHIEFVRLSGSSLTFGVVVGQNSAGTYLFANSVAASNYIKDVKQSECVSLSNTWSVTGC
ncbi:Conserved_hypothetical protein [Hexamita inflata]|uniref:Uncharacterized protein n=2 Tax=Hexamita inflata TaxID=28002 RepID=A0AA86V014_9EUKA|nr:Conserved hypothetical protein [Hexamita inflata]